MVLTFWTNGNERHALDAYTGEPLCGTDDIIVGYDIDPVLLIGLPMVDLCCRACLEEAKRQKTKRWMTS